MSSENNDEVTSLLTFNLKTCNKNELQMKAIKMQTDLKDSNNVNNSPSSKINELDSTMIAAIITRLDQLEHDNKVLKKEVRELNNYADECDEQMYYMGQQLNQLDQYI